MFNYRISALYRKWPLLVWLVVGAPLFTMPLHLNSAPTLDEYKIKVALIYKLSKFIVWPDHSTNNTGDKFNICLLGEDDFGVALDALAGRKATGRSIQVRRFSQSESISTDCKILFISESKRTFLTPILTSLGRQSILTLSDMEGFAQQGGMIQFTRGKRRIGFKINLASVRQSNIKIAAALLDLATIVGPDKPRVVR